MAGQRLEIAARLIRRAIVPVSLATIVALPMVAAQTAGSGGQPPATSANGGARAGRGNPGGRPGGGRFGGGRFGGGRFGGGRRRGGRGTGPAFGNVPGTRVPAVTIEGGSPAGPAVAAPSTFRIATPADGTMVRGVVAVQVPAGNMEDGSYVSFAINDPLSSTPGQGLQFATIRNSNSGTFVWDWDTRAVGTDGNPIFPDKNYTIYVTAHDPFGREMANGEAQITVTVSNFLPRSTGPVRLSYRLAVGDQQNYVANYSLSPHMPGEEASAPKITGSAQWDVSVDDIDRTAGIASLSALFDDVSAEDLAVVRNGRLTANWSATFFQNLFGQRTASFDLTPDGELTPVGRPGPFDWARVGLAGNIYIPLRDTPVGVGDRWNGPMTIWTLGNHDHRTKVGDTTNTLEAFEWMDGVKTAKIRTDYEVNLPPPGQQTAAAAGPQLGGMGSSFTPGGGYPGMGGSPGMGGGTSPVMATGTLKGQRYTWFDYQHGRVVRVIDSRTITNLPSLFNASGGGAGGGGGYPGMGSAGMAGGGASAADLSWLPGFQYSAAAAQAITSQGVAGSGGMGGGYPAMGGGGGYPGMGGMPGMMGGGMPGMMGGGMPGMMGGGYPGMGGGGYPGMGGGGGYPGMGGGGGYPGMGGGGYPGMGGGGYPGMGGGGGYPGMGGMPGATPFNNAAGGTGGVSPFQVQEPPTFDEVIDTSLVTGSAQYF